MIGVNLQTSFLTPPFGFALFYLRGVAPKEVTTGHIYRGIVPFVVLQLVGIALLWTFPQMATWLPDVVYGGRAVVSDEDFLGTDIPLGVDPLAPQGDLLFPGLENDPLLPPGANDPLAPGSQRPAPCRRGPRVGRAIRGAS